MSSSEQSAMTSNFKSGLSHAIEDLKASEGAASTHHLGSSLAVNAADDSADEYQSDDYEDEHDHEDPMMIDTQETTHIGAHHTMILADKEAKQRYADEQVGFIILTRDNNKPDAYGAVSETYGPVPWPGVAKAYNEKYKLSVGPAAMEKRVRQHRGAWMEKHPAYPINIEYTKKPKVSPVRRSEVLTAKHQDSRLQSSVGGEQIRHTGEGVDADELQTPVELLENNMSNDRIGGWVPPDIIRNQADQNKYLEQIRSAQVERFVMELFDVQNVSLGTVVADREDLLRSSAVFQRLMEGNSEAQVQLHCSAITVVESYMHCTSSRELTELPAHLLHDSSALMRLYCFAAQLEDDWTCELILALWHRSAESNVEMNLGLEDLNLLFECTRSGDPARNFWAATVYTVGLADHLVGIDECNMGLIAEIQDVVARASV